MSSWMKELRWTTRSLLRRPGFTAVALFTLALGIGANAGLFSVIDAVLLKPLPYPEGDRLVRLLGVRQGKVGGPISYPNFVDWRDLSTTLASAAAYDEWSPDLTGVGDPERLDAARVTSSFFEVLGVKPAVGRFFVPQEDVDGHDRVVVLTHDLWQRRFGGDPSAVGRRVLLNGRPHEVVGILPESFEDPLLSGGRWGKPELFRPLGFDGLPAEEMPGRSGNSFTAIARLAPGATLELARAEIATVTARLAAEYPEEMADRSVFLAPLKEHMVGGAQRSLLLLLGAVGLVLAIAVANVVNLLLSRAADRHQEMTLRAALGASRGRLLRHFLTESLLLTVAGCVLGSALAWSATRFLVFLGGAGIPRAESVTVDLRVVGATALVALGVTLICGLLPAVFATAELPSPLRESGPLGGRSRWRLKGALVVSEVALSLLLLTSAGLLIRSFWKLHQVDVGVDTRDVLTFQLTPPSVRYPDAKEVGAFLDEILERLGTLPGVEGVAATSLLPLSGNFDGNAVRADDQPPPPPGQRRSAQTRTVTPSYLEVMGMTVLRGRGLAETDLADAPQVAVINESLAELFWPGQDPIGRRLTAHGVSSEVVGVVADVKHLRLDQPAPPRIYFARAQAVAPWQIRRMNLVLRSAVEPLSLLPQIRREVWAVDPDLPLAHVLTLRQMVSASAADSRFRTVLLSTFAGLALLLAAVGIYGVLSYAVTERRREIAVRMALGAERGAVLRFVTGKGLVLVAFGLALGLFAALAVTRLLEGLLFEVSATDPASFVAVPAVLFGVAFLASYLPARRATKIDPMSTLRT